MWSERLHAELKKGKKLSSITSKYIYLNIWSDEFQCKQRFGLGVFIDTKFDDKHFWITSLSVLNFIINYFSPKSVPSSLIIFTYFFILLLICICKLF